MWDRLADCESSGNWAIDTGNVDTVLIAGRVMKSKGELLHVDWPAVRRMAAESRDHVVSKSGFKPPSI